MRPIPWSRFEIELLSIYLPPMRAAATYRQMRQILREIGSVPGVTSTASGLNEQTISHWIRSHPGRSAARTASLLRCLSRAANYAVRKRYIDASPFVFIPAGQWVRSDSRHTGRRAPGHRTSDEIARILELVDSEACQGTWEAGRLQALVHTYAYTGLRKQEALHLEVKDLNLASRFLTVEPKPGWSPKTVKSSARLPIAEPLAAVLRVWSVRCGSNWLFPGKRLRTPWTAGSPGARALDQVRAAGERAGVAGLTILSFRKTIGTYAKQWGFSQLELKALLRHSNVETQRWYDEDDVEVLSPAVGKIQFRIANSS